MFTNEMKAQMTLFTNTFEDGSFSLYIEDEFDSTFYNIEFLMKFIIDEGFIITEIGTPYYSHDMSVDVSKPKTSKELIDEGLSFKEINRFMKEQEESIQRQFEFLDDIEDDFQAYNEKTPEMSKLISAAIEEMKKSSPFSSPAPAGRGGLVFMKKPVIKAKYVEPVSQDFVKINGTGIRLITPLTESDFNKLKENFEKNGGKMP